jgi:hypothetical protein
MMSAITAAKDPATGKVDPAKLLEKYKEISGKRVRGLSGVGEEFEKATFMTLDEVIGNEPVNAEVERMKRGYGAMQFARMKSYLKDSWHQANPPKADGTPPPPYPTYGDIKSWSDHGGIKPEWAGSTRLALPKEVHDATHKSPDGKPKHPPAWMPIHMLPTWNYAAKSGEKMAASRPNGNAQSYWETKTSRSGEKYVEGYSAAKTPERDQSSKTGWKLNLGNQARSGQELADHGAEGHIVNAMRKYIQMRGGVDQLTDIPSANLSGLGITHADLFKSMKFDNHDLSDKALKKLCAHKIIDPIALAPFIDEEIKSNKPIKKSWSLVIDADAPKNDFKKSFVIDTKKSELIKKIKLLKARV